MSDPNNSNLSPSEEGSEHLVTERLLAEDWHLRFSANAAASRALKAEIEEKQDPDRVPELIEMKGEALLGGLGSGAISLYKRGVLAEQEQFEAEFGSQGETEE